MGFWRENKKNTILKLRLRQENNIKIDAKETGWRAVCGLDFYLAQDRNK